MMGVCIISKYYPPKIDGVGDHTYCLQQELIKNEINCTIITESPEFPLVQENIPKIITAIQTKQINHVILQYVGYSFSKKGAPFWLINFFKELKKNNLQIHLFVHETYIRSGTSLKTKIYHYLQKKCLQLLCAKADKIYCNLSFYQQQIKNLGYKSILCPTPSNFENIYEESVPQLILKDEKIIFSSFGNRDYKYALDILKHLEHKGFNFEFHIWGKINPLFLKAFENIEEKLREKIKIFKNSSSQDIIKGMEKSHIFLFPEFVSPKGEGGLNSKSGTSATAFMLGLPIISTWGDMSDKNIFIADYNCIIIPPKDSLEASKKIEDYLKLPEKINQIGLNAKKTYQKELGWKNLILTLNSSLNGNTK